jgi:hypothetical protein
MGNQKGAITGLHPPKGRSGVQSRADLPPGHTRSKCRCQRRCCSPTGQSVNTFDNLTSVRYHHLATASCILTSTGLQTDAAAGTSCTWPSMGAATSSQRHPPIESRPMHTLASRYSRKSKAPSHCSMQMEPMIRNRCIRRRPLQVLPTSGS